MIDLTGKPQIKFDMRASRTGSNIKVGIRNNPSYISNADIDDEDMADLSDWTDDDGGTGTSTQTTFDSKSCMKLDSGAAWGYAGRYQDIGTFGARTVFSMNIYCDSVGTLAADDAFNLMASQTSKMLDVKFASDGLFVHDGSTYNEVGTNLVVQDTWQEWTFDVNWTAQTVDVYLDKVLKASGVDCSKSSGDPNGKTWFILHGYTTYSKVVYIDWFKAGSTLLTGVTTEITPNITSADTYQTVTWDISAVADADKNAIDKIIITIVNADAANTFYIDNMFADISGYSLDVGSGSYSLTGVASGTLANRLLPLSIGTYTIEGLGASLLLDRLLLTNVGSYISSGIDITPIYNRLLNVESGTYDLTGAEAQALFGHLLIAENGTYDLTGFNALLNGVGFIIDALHGSYNITGDDASLFFGRALNAGIGSYILTGEDITILINHVLSGDLGTYTILGEDITFQNVVGWLNQQASDGTWIKCGSVTDTYKPATEVSDIWVKLK